MTPPFKRQVLLPGSAMPRHRHAEPYVAVVVAGAYLESGDRGRRRLVAGDVVCHDACDAHLDVVGATGATVLNLDMSPAIALPAFATTGALDAIVRAAEAGDAGLALALLAQSCIAAPALDTDWPDLLARALAATPALSLLDWAEAHALAPTRLSAPFVDAFGVTPKRFRAEAKARLAVRLLREGRHALAEVAQLAEFCDQAHMTRAVRAMTGATPAQLRHATSAGRPAR